MSANIGAARLTRLDAIGSGGEAQGSALPSDG